MVNFDDNIMRGACSWEFPYRFIVGRKSKWDESVEVLGWTTDPETAYRAYMEVSEDPANFEILWEYFLHDSFHIDAEDFCKEAYEKSEEY